MEKTCNEKTEIVEVATKPKRKYTKRVAPTESTVPTTPTMKETSIASLTKKQLMEIFKEEAPDIEEARLLVDLYYQMQSFRITSAAQARSAEKFGEDGTLVSFFSSEFAGIENQIKKTLEIYTDLDPIGHTLKQITGIGPVIAAGLISNLDITKANTAGSYWRYCGIDPSLQKPTKGLKLQYNKKLKCLVVFKLGESFVKVNSNPSDFYGKIYKVWKEIYTQKNEMGLFKSTAEASLLGKNWKDKNCDTYKCYASGKLPPAHIHAMARRKPLMLFISHLFDLQYMIAHECDSILPYVHAHLNHVHILANPLVEIYERDYGKIPKTDHSHAKNNAPSVITLEQYCDALRESVTNIACQNDASGIII